MNQRGRCENAEGILLADIPIDLWWVGCGVSECSENTLDEIHQSGMFALLAVCS